MPIRKDGSGKRWVEMEFVVPGTPEQVWQAVATGEGNTAWFTRTEIEEKVGGKLLFDLGPMGESKGEVTVWEPPRKFGYVEREWGEGVPPLATEITVQARKGGQCVVRMVHSLFTSQDDWDDQVESFEGGWPGFFAVLRLYLAHFAGQRARSVRLLGPGQGDALAVWKKLLRETGLEGKHVGERVVLSAQLGALDGTVKQVEQGERQRWTVVHLDGAAQGIAILGTFTFDKVPQASGCVWFYGDDAAKAQANEAAWQGFWASRFPALPDAAPGTD